MPKDTPLTGCLEDYIGIIIRPEFDGFTQVIFCRLTLHSTKIWYPWMQGAFAIFAFPPQS